MKSIGTPSLFPHDARGVSNHYRYSRRFTLGLLTRNIFQASSGTTAILVYGFIRHITPPHKRRIQVSLRYRRILNWLRRIFL
jgi:hypothetical protein